MFWNFVILLYEKTFKEPSLSYHYLTWQVAVYMTLSMMTDVNVLMARRLSSYRLSVTDVLTKRPI